MSPEDQEKLKKEFIAALMANAARHGAPPRPDGKKSYFEEEAERIANLNRPKKRKNMKALGILLLALGGIVGFFLLWLYGIFAYGFVAVKLWAWFVTPIFPMLAEYKFSVLQAAGLFMFVRFFTTNVNYAKNDPDEELSDKVGKMLVPIILPWVTLFFGWILHLILT